MEKYIPLNAVVAEIEGRINNLHPKEGQGIVVTKILKDHYKDFLSFINTLEVKEFNKKNLYVITRCEEHSDYVEEVFFSKEKAEEYCKQFEGNEDAYGRDITEIKVDYPTIEVKDIDLESEERMRECPYRQVGCTMYEGKVLECKGACSWVVDYPKLKELKERIKL